MVKHIFAVVLAAALAASAFAAGADALRLPNPLRHVAAGQWVRYRLNTLFGVAEQKHTVLGVDGSGDDALITIKTETILDGETVDEREVVSTYRKILDDQASALDDAENPSAEPCDTEACGATFPAVAVRYTREGQNYTLFLSDEIPLAGVVRLVMEGTEDPVMELIDFGD